MKQPCAAPFMHCVALAEEGELYCKCHKARPSFTSKGLPRPTRPMLEKLAEGE